MPINIKLKAFTCMFLVQILSIHVRSDVSPMWTYNNFVNLVQNDFYNLYWNYTSSSIIAEIHVQTAGWVSFGITVNGNLDNSDTMVAWVNDDGTSTLLDCYVKNNQLFIDKLQNWILLNATKTGGYTVIQFKRDINLCSVDTNEDLNILSGTPYVSYSWSDAIPLTYIDYFNKNTNVQPVPLISAVQNSAKTSNLFSQSFSLNTLLSNAEQTSFSCRLISLSSNWNGSFTTLKRHLIQVKL